MGAVTSIVSGIANNCNGLGLSVFHAVVDFSSSDEAGFKIVQASNVHPVNNDEYA